MRKLYIIDIYRGVFAFSIMIYHFFSWLEYPENKLLKFLSVYGVESFFIISGIVLTYVYRENSIKIKDFFLARFFRIAPLFYFLLMVEIAFKIISNQIDFSFLLRFFFGDLLFLNIFRPDLTNVVSGWSIMVEVGFYLLFPVIMLLRNKHIYILSIIIYAITFYLYNEHIFSLEETLATQNHLYVSVLFHFPFFLFGIVIGLLRISYKFFNFKTVYPLSLITILVVLFPFIICNNESHSSMFNIMGSYRIMSSILIILLMGVSAFTILNYKNKITTIFGFLSRISYSLYLMHFIVFYFFVNFLKIDNILILIFSSITVSFLTYELIEKKLTRSVKKYAYK